MRDDSTRTELMAIPIVAVLFGIGLVLFIASVKGVWAWLFVGAAGLVLAAVLIARYSRRNPHPAAATPAPTVPPASATAAAGADSTYRVLVIADESCVEPSFAAELSDHAGGRKIEALVIAPAIGRGSRAGPAMSLSTSMLGSISTTPSPPSRPPASPRPVRRERTIHCRRPTTA